MWFMLSVQLSHPTSKSTPSNVLQGKHYVQVRLTRHIGTVWRPLQLQTYTMYYVLAFSYSVQKLPIIYLPMLLKHSSHRLRQHWHCVNIISYWKERCQYPPCSRDCIILGAACPRLPSQPFNALYGMIVWIRACIRADDQTHPPFGENLRAHNWQANACVS